MPTPDELQPDLCRSDNDTSAPSEESEVEALMDNMAALEAVFEAVQGTGSTERAVSLAKQALRSQARAPRSFEEYLVHVSLSRVAGLPLSKLGPTPSVSPTWVTFVYETVAAAWLRWFTSGDTSAIGLMVRIRAAEPDTHHVPGGAVELLSLSEWGQAVEALAEGDFGKARRHFERAVEVGAQIGSDSNPSINWTYAASIFPQ